MSFVTVLRDYIETLNTVSTSLDENLTLTQFLSETFHYLVKTLQNGVLYFVSFQWIRDFTLLPIVLPQNAAALFKETFVLETPSNVFFDFLEIPDLHQNKFLLGFFNSFFLTLPVSIIHIVTVRRLLIQGIPSAVYSIGGYFFGQILFLSCTIFGIRSILIPWLTVEPLNYILGLIVIFRVLHSMVRENLVPLKGWNFLDSPQYRTFFVTSFILAWCEQTSMFQYLGNVTVSSNVTVLESFSSTSPLSNFFTHLFYLVGISCGLVVFTALWGLFFLQLKTYVRVYSPLILATFLQRLNKTTFVVAIALSLTSLPFYGADYVLTGPLGFFSQDSVFNNTFFSQKRLKDLSGVSLLSSEESMYKFFDVDIAAFDHGDYLIDLKNEVTQPLGFEDLNYRGEFSWIRQQDKQDTLIDRKNTQFSLAKFFGKSKTVKEEPKERPQTQFNFIPSESYYELDALVEDPTTTVIPRFQDTTELPYRTDPNLKPYYQLYINSFPTDAFRINPVVKKQSQATFKEKYYANTVYKTLLTLDVDSFLNRQSRSFRLSADQEADLFTKRRILESYYNSLRQYAALPYSETFEAFFDGTKSFSNKVYNQQFKGTLHPVRRLFSLTLNNTTADQSSQKVLKFDQPAYQFPDKPVFSPYHEELVPQGNVTEKTASLQTQALTKPLYAGWDEHLRKFVITNKFLPRKWAGSKVNIQPEIRRNFSQDSSKQPPKQKLKFTAWPLSKDKLMGDKKLSPIPYVTLFEALNEQTSKKFNLVETLPANLERYERVSAKKGDSTELPDQFASLAPKRGGFLWPGNARFDFSRFGTFDISQFFKR